MRELITIGELAKLMNISTHQIRYFEEKNVLRPSKINENGYRLYSIKDVYKLSHILLLRKFNISVKGINKCFNDYTFEDYMHMLTNNIVNIEKQIKDLNELKNLTSSVVDKISYMKDNKEKYLIKNMKSRKVKSLCKVENIDSVSIKSFYDNTINHPKLINLFENDMIYVYEKNNINVCTEFFNNESDYVFEEGDYLCYGFYSDSYSESYINVDKKALEFLSYAKAKNIKVEGKLIIIENSLLSMCNNTEVYYEIQMFINNK